MSKPRYYWHGFIQKTIKQYPDRLGDSRFGKEAFHCIQESIVETRGMKDTGYERICAIQLVFLNKTHTIDGAALALHISKRTVERWCSDFVYLVAEKLGYI